MTNNSRFISSKLTQWDSGLEFLVRKSWISLLIIGVLSLSLRLVFFVELPLTFDALSYFTYANDFYILGKIPSIQLELGWPVFLSFIFSLIRFENILDYMILQRLTSVILSILTIIPVYFLGKRFFERPYPLIGSAIFGFEPHLIQNSIMGISEPLFILLGTTALVFFLSNNIKLIYSSFALVALFVIVRSQGIFLFVIFSILFIIHYRKDKKILRQYVILLGIFFLILTPVMFERQASLGYDLFIKSTTSAGILLTSTDDYNSKLKQDIVLTGSKVLLNQLGKSLIPYFILFLPFGFLLLLKDLDFKKSSILFILISTILTAMYILAFNHDMRHIFFVFPIYSVISLFAIKHVSDKIVYKNLFLSLMILSVIIMSGYFLYTNDDRSIQIEANDVSNFISSNTVVINGQTLVSHYVSSNFYLDEKFPLSSTKVEKKIQIVNLYAKSVEEYIKLAKEKHLTHIIIDSDNPRVFPLDDVFYYPEKYPYLHEIYDSTEHGFRRYHVKVFEIDYNQYNEISLKK